MQINLEVIKLYSGKKNKSKKYLKHTGPVKPGNAVYHSQEHWSQPRVSPTVRLRETCSHSYD